MIGLNYVDTVDRKGMIDMKKATYHMKHVTCRFSEIS